MKELSGEDFLKMSVEERMAFFAVEPKTTATKKRMFTGRKFTLIAYGKSETRTIENVGRTVVNRLKISLKKEGFYRVDVIETKTVVNENISGVRTAREMQFGQQKFIPAETKFQPVNLPEDKKARQTTIAWEYFGEKQDDAWLDNRPVTKVADRAAKRKAEQKRIEIFNRINAKNASPEKMKIFNRINGNFLYSSVEEIEILEYLLNNKLSLEDVVLYVPIETYNAFKALEK